MERLFNIKNSKSETENPNSEIWLFFNQAFAGNGRFNFSFQFFL
jgi:hypothetical protein